MILRGHFLPIPSSPYLGQPTANHITVLWGGTVTEHNGGNNKQTLIRNISRPHNSSNLFHWLKVRWQPYEKSHILSINWHTSSHEAIQRLVINITSMTTEYLLIQYGCHRQAVETICKSLPQSYVIPSFTCPGRKCNLKNKPLAVDNLSH